MSSGESPASHVTCADNFLDRSELECDPGPATMDNIRTEFHPHTKVTTRVEAFSDFKRTHHREPPPPNPHPWLPFDCRLDFEVAELAHEAALTHEQTTRLIQLVKRGRTEDFTLNNYTNVRNIWEAASHRMTPVRYYLAACHSHLILHSSKKILLQFRSMVQIWSTQFTFDPFGIGL